MGKFTGMLFTSDFDHTISDLQGNVPRENLEAIDYFIREGGKFCLNTGRSIPMARKRALQVPCNAPCLLYNGAACYDYRNEELIFAHPLPDFAPELLSLLRDPELGAEIQCIDGHYSPALIPSREPLLRKEGVETIITENIPLPWMKIVLCGCSGTVAESYSQVDPRELQRFQALREQVREICAGRCYVTSSLPRVIEIGNPHCSKGTGARELARRLNCHTLICAGDAPNDASMLAEADYGFCPGDCSPEILAMDGVIVTVPSDRGCIAQAVGYLDQGL